MLEPILFLATILKLDQGEPKIKHPSPVTRHVMSDKNNWVGLYSILYMYWMLFSHNSCQMFADTLAINEFDAMDILRPMAQSDDNGIMKEFLENNRF